MVEFGVLAKVMKSVENSKKGETFFYVYWTRKHIMKK
jgi:hypothetical protein